MFFFFFPTDSGVSCYFTILSVFSAAKLNMLAACVVLKTISGRPTSLGINRPESRPGPGSLKGWDSAHRDSSL